MEGMRLRDLSSIIITTSKRFYPLKFMIENEERMLKVAKGFIVNTFDDLECDALNALWRSHLSRPSIYPIGPLHLLDKEAITSNIDLEEIEMNPWEEEPECLEWLDSNEPNSVLYVNFGTTTFVTHDQLTEFAWGLANSNQPFLWIIRPDLLVHGEKSTLPPEFLESMKKRGKLANWCPQEKVLGHSSIGGFLTHGGWNSILESMSCGVPMICWPFFSDQMTNCWRCCTGWGIGMEMNGVNREVVERLVTELLTGDKGREMKKKAMEWKMLAHRSANNSSRQNLEKVISQLVSPLTGPE